MKILPLIFLLTLSSCAPQRFYLVDQVNLVNYGRDTDVGILLSGMKIPESYWAEFQENCRRDGQKIKVTGLYEKKWGSKNITKVEPE